MKNTRHIPCIACLASIASWAAFSSPAHANLINASFEAAVPFNPPGTWYVVLPSGSTAIPGWTVVNDDLAWMSNANPNIHTTDGQYFLDLTGTSDAVPHGGVTQTISTDVGEIYTLSLSLGAIFFDSTYGTALGGTKTVSVTAGSASTSFSFTPSPGVDWGNYSFDFEATAATTPITIIGTDAGSGPYYLGLDSVNVQLAPVPEPTAFAASLLCLGAGLMRRWRA